MLRVVFIFLCLGVGNGLVSQSTRVDSRRVCLRVESEKVAENEAPPIAVAAPRPTEEGESRPPLPKKIENVRRVKTTDAWYTRALPFQERPELLDGSLAADAGFDPFGLVRSRVDLYNFREAEIKHARLALLGAAGWPLAELWDTRIAEFFGLPSIIEENAGRDPSILNGGLGLISPVYWISILIFGAAVEVRGEYVKSLAKENDKTWMLTGSWVPGDLGFDPLGLYNSLGDNERGKYLQETAELKNGRLAMCAIVFFVIEELVTGRAVVDITPLLFKPFPQVVEDLMFSSPALSIFEQ